MSPIPWQPYFGASWTTSGRVRFRIWAPTTERAEIHLGDRVVRMRRHPDDTHTVQLDGLRPGDRYRIGLDGEGPYPDPWSRWQPDGVHGPSALVAPAGRLGHRAVPSRVAQATYELHFGTFTHHGTYQAAVGDLRRLKRLGIDTIQVMPVVSTRSITVSTRHSSAMMPPSPFSRWLRLNPVAMIWDEDGFGTRSPASWSIVNWSNGKFRLKASITQSLQGH